MQTNTSTPSLKKNIWISDINVWSYGPLTDINFDGLEPNLVLMYGPNESGKTLLLEAILKSLLKLSKDFSQDDRVEEDPNSKIVLKKKFEDDLELYNFPENKKKLDKIMEIELKNQPFDKIFRNTFVIRNSDLGLIEEKGYFSTISNIMMGWDYEDLENIKNNIREKGRLTDESTSTRPTLINVKSKKIKNLRKSAEGLSKEIMEYIKKSKEEKYEEYEIKILAAKKSIADYKKRLKYLEIVDGKSKFIKVKNFLDEYTNVYKKFEQLREFNEGAENQLKSYNENIEALKNRIEEVEKEKLTNKGDLSQTEQNKAKLELKFNNLIQIKTEKEILKKNLEDWKSRSVDIKQVQNLNKYIRWSTILAILTLATLPGSIISLILDSNIPGFAFMITAVIFAIMAIFYISKYYSLLNSQKSLITILSHSDEIKIDSSIDIENNKYYENLINESSISTIKYWLEKIEENLNNFFNEIDDLKEKIVANESNIDLLIGRIEKNQKNINEYTIDLNSIQSEKTSFFIKLGIKNDDEFIKKFKDRLDFANSLERTKSLLQQFFGDDTNTIKEWQEGIQRKYEKFKDADVETYDLLTGVHNEQKEIQKKITDDLPKVIEEWSNKLEQHRNNLRLLSNKAISLNLKDFDIVEEDLEINSANQLEVLLQNVSELISLIDNDKELARMALEILEEIEKEEEERIIELFRSGEISNLFKKITNGKYIDVQFNQDFDKNKENYISIKNTEGIQQYSNLLSLGTWDQLYFSIRFALAQKLLKENTGFFIFDDAFITSDTDRLRNQFNILKEFARNKWQIIYFSNKREILELFRENEIGSIYQLSPL